MKGRGECEAGVNLVLVASTVIKLCFPCICFMFVCLQ